MDKEQKFWDIWLTGERDPQAILRAKELYETYGEREGYLKSFTADELKVYEDFCQRMPFLRGEPLRPLEYREIRYILPVKADDDAIETHIYNKVIAYDKVCNYKAILR